MIYEKLYLKDLYDFYKGDATLEVFSLNDYVETPLGSTRPGLLVVPGGGYAFVSKREGAPIAARYNAEGFTCFVLDYTINHKYPTPQNEVALAMDYIERNCKKYNIYSKSTSIIGFSAGGHLTASYGAYYEEIGKALNLDVNNLRPFSIILSYPVITFDKPTHGGTRDVITEGDEVLLDKLSIEKHVTSSYPPTYIWTTSKDTCVPPINTDVMVEALNKANVTYKSHIYPTGEHGGSLFSRCVSNDPGWSECDYKVNRDWINESVDFVYELLDKQYGKI